MNCDLIFFLSSFFALCIFCSNCAIQAWFFFLDPETSLFLWCFPKTAFYPFDEMISDNKMGRLFSLLQLHFCSDSPPARQVGWLAGWWVVGLPSYLSAQCSPLHFHPLPPPTPHLHAAQPNHSDPLLCILDTHPPACPRSALSRVDALCVHKIAMTCKK